MDDIYFLFSDGYFYKLRIDRVKNNEDIEPCSRKKNPFFAAENEFLFFKMRICFFPKGYRRDWSVGRDKFTYIQ